LVVLEDSPERQEIEKFWVMRLGCSQSQIAEVLKVLFALTAEVNKIAEEVKTVWLHSRTESKHPHGLFNYAFFSAELGDILENRFSEVRDSEMFLDRVFDVLLERTRESLKTTRERIDDELRQRLGKAVDDAVGELSHIQSTQQLLTIKNDLLACRQVVERLCDQMINWFQEADATLMGDAGIDLVARTAIGMVEQLNPEVISKFQFEVGG
jgi:c-di-GMP-related signal transduction protein